MSVMFHLPHAADAALSWLMVDSRARLMITRTQQVVWHNQGAARLIDDADGLDLRDGYLICAAGNTGSKLGKFLAGLGTRLSTLVLPREDGAAHLLLRGWKVEFKGDPLCCIELVSDDQDFAVEYRDIDAVFRLTRSEHRVILGLLQGSQVTALAERLGVSVDTVRTHVRHIYDKVGANSREELFALMHPYRIM